MSDLRFPALVACAMGLLAGPGCMPSVAHGALQVPEMPGDQTRCRVSASHENPLVTEWPASEKANFETRMSEGAVVVSYSGCALKVLRNCRVGGSYAWHQTTLSTDTVEIHDADDLFAKLPLGALSLEGELARSGRLAVQTTVSGQLQLRGFEGAAIPRDEACAGATHVVSALSVGAFKLLSGGSAKVGGGVNVAALGGGKATSSSDESVMRTAGDFGRCGSSTAETPDAQCASPIQVFLRPLPSSVVDRGPQGTMKIRFLPVRPEEPWDVMVGDRKICTTPCERWVDPSIPYTLKYDPGFLYRNQYWELPDLRKYESYERAQVRVEPRAMGEFVGGILVTTFSGIAAVVGTSLTAVGCSGGTGACTAGLITLPIGLAGLAPGIWMIADSAGEVHVEPIPAGPKPAWAED